MNSTNLTQKSIDIMTLQNLANEINKQQKLASYVFDFVDEVVLAEVLALDKS